MSLARFLGAEGVTDEPPYRDPTVKRTMCKGCSAVLVPGVTCTVRIKRAFVSSSPASGSLLTALLQPRDLMDTES